MKVNYVNYLSSKLIFVFIMLNFFSCLEYNIDQDNFLYHIDWKFDTLLNNNKYLDTKMSKTKQPKFLRESCKLSTDIYETVIVLQNRTKKYYKT